jgi:hypothetical protein
VDACPSYYHCPNDVSSYYSSGATDVSEFPGSWDVVWVDDRLDYADAGTFFALSETEIEIFLPLAICEMKDHHYSEIFHDHSRFLNYFRHYECTAFYSPCDAIYWDPFLRLPVISCPNSRWCCWFDVHALSSLRYRFPYAYLLDDLDLWREIILATVLEIVEIIKASNLNLTIDSCCIRLAIHP